MDTFEKTILEVLDLIKNEETVIEEEDCFKERLLNSIKEKYKGDIPEYGKSEPTEYELKHCFVKNYVYRNISADIFIDEDGQTYYTYLFGTSHVAGAFTPLDDVNKMIEYIVDEKLDVKYRYTEKKYFGAVIRKDSSNKSDENLYLFYRGKKLCSIPMEDSDDEQVLYGQRILDSLAGGIF